MIGNVIKQVRELKDIKQNALALECGITTTYLNYIEKNKRNPSVDILQKLSKALEIPLSVLTFLSFNEDEVRFKDEYKKLVPIIDQLLLTLLKKKMNMQPTLKVKLTVPKTEFVNTTPHKKIVKKNHHLLAVH